MPHHYNPRNTIKHLSIIGEDFQFDKDTNDDLTPDQEEQKGDLNHSYPVKWKSEVASPIKWKSEVASISSKMSLQQQNAMNAKMIFDQKNP